jgi:hypothetical protein
VTAEFAPNLYPAAIGVWRPVLPSWAGMAAVRGAEPSVDLSAADWRSVDGGALASRAANEAAGEPARQASSTTRACGSERNKVSLSNSSRKRSMNDSAKAALAPAGGP